MFKKEPEGYRKLLAYQKAIVLQQDTNELVRFLPKTKTFLDLADQMARSGRSGSKNIVEGWNRTTTKEYFTFLGFAVGAVKELMEDAADVATGVYPELMGVREIMGERRKGEGKGVRGERFVKGVMGEKGSVDTADLSSFTHRSRYTSYSSESNLEPLSKALMTREELDKIKFYPLDITLPPIVKLFLKAKEVSYLIYKLQQSLDVKMDNEGTKPTKDKFRERLEQEKEADRFMEQMYKDLDMVRLPNGQFVTKEKLVEGNKGTKGNNG